MRIGAVRFSHLYFISVVSEKEFDMPKISSGFDRVVRAVNAGRMRPRCTCCRCVIIAEEYEVNPKTKTFKHRKACRIARPTKRSNRRPLQSASL